MAGRHVWQGFEALLAKQQIAFNFLSYKGVFCKPEEVKASAPPWTYVHLGVGMSGSLPSGACSSNGGRKPNSLGDGLRSRFGATRSSLGRMGTWEGVALLGQECAAMSDGLLGHRISHKTSFTGRQPLPWLSVFSQVHGLYPWHGCEAAVARRQFVYGSWRRQAAAGRRPMVR